MKLLGEWVQKSFTMLIKVVLFLGLFARQIFRKCISPLLSGFIGQHLQISSNFCKEIVLKYILKVQLYQKTCLSMTVFYKYIYIFCINNSLLAFIFHLCLACRTTLVLSYFCPNFSYDNETKICTDHWQRELRDRTSGVLVFFLVGCFFLSGKEDSHVARVSRISN